MLVTLRLVAGLPSLRSVGAREVVWGSLRSIAERPEFRVVHVSLQSNHVHGIVEAACERELARGVQGLCVRIARRLNRRWRRAGTVFSDHYHARGLHSLREVRNALVYVLNNARKHGMQYEGPDPFSSGPWFDGWRDWPARSPMEITSVARTWLLTKGWMQLGRIGVEESPASPRKAGRGQSGSRS